MSRMYTRDMDIQIDKLTVETNAQDEVLISRSGGDPLLLTSFKERAHASSVANAFDFARRSSAEAPEKPLAKVPPTPGEAGPPQADPTT